MNVFTNNSARRCPVCNLSKDLETADLVHVRIGLDEAPEPVVCKCKPVHEIVQSTVEKVTSALELVNLNVRETMNTTLRPNINTAWVSSISKSPIIEVEARLNSDMSKSLYQSMESGKFGCNEESNIVERGCSWWTGSGTNQIAKLRIRNETDMTAKITASTCHFMPGITVAVSYEYPFHGDIMRSEYITKMHEISTVVTIASVRVKLISRKYMCEDTTSYASEVEFENGIKHTEIRAVMSRLVKTVGSMPFLRRFIAFSYMDDLRQADHDVVDVTDLNQHAGTIMHKVDGMKVYIFCYPSGYVITQTDERLSVISYVVSTVEGLVFSCNDTPDVIVAEMMLNGMLVYIDTLSIDGVALDKTRKHLDRPVTTYQVPPMYMRRSWKKMSDVPSGVFTSLETDGFVCVTNSRTLRLKEPTIDLLYKDGYLHASDTGKFVRICQGHESMLNNSIYELKVTKHVDKNKLTLSDPTKRLVKKRPNNIDIVKRAFASMLSESGLSTVLYDVTTMSFKMRKRVYEMAQSNASMRRKVIVTFGIGRFQEINEMMLDSYSYIAVDPNIDITRLKKGKIKARITEYDPRKDFSKQVIAIGSRPGNVLYCGKTSEEFIRYPDVIPGMRTYGIPCVFSFSISYHIAVINTLKASGIVTYGCGFVHDDMPIKGVGKNPVSMNVKRDHNGKPYINAVFGKSTYAEPILKRNSVSGMHPVESVFPGLWADVDESTKEIMSRAVLMY